MLNFRFKCFGLRSIVKNTVSLLIIGGCCFAYIPCVEKVFALVYINYMQMLLMWGCQPTGLYRVDSMVTNVGPLCPLEKNQQSFGTERKLIWDLSIVG